MYAIRSYYAGLSGRVLKLDESEESYTDTETLFLPPLLNLLPSREQNFQRNNFV